jgi:signal transduction histidine kinase
MPDRVGTYHRALRPARLLNLGANGLPLRAGVTRLSGLSWLLMVLMVSLGQIAEADEAKHVLVIYSQSRLLPANIEFDEALREVLQADPAQQNQIFSEFLDEPDFGGDKYELTISTYLREKYALRPPDVLVVSSDRVLRFLLRFRDRLFPTVPIVYSGVTQDIAQSIPNMPPDVVGVSISYDFAGTARLALELRPRAKRLVIVGGASDTDVWLTSLLRAQLVSLPRNAKVEYWSGLTTPVLRERLRALSDDSVVLTLGFFRDGDGRAYVPRDAIALVATESAVPVYTAFDISMGSGVVGGRMLSFAQIGRLGGEIVGRLLHGDPNWRVMPPPPASVVHVDWRQIQRWGIDPKLLPQDSLVDFRAPTFWQAYRNVAIGAAAIILLQSVFVVTLLLERRRRRTAEVALQKQHIALAHASRLVVAGELTAAIAHEINQPLGAVQTNADTAEVILEAGGDRREDLLRLVGRIRSDNQRASQVIRRLRALLAKHEPRREPLDANEILTDVQAFLKSELDRRDLALVLRLEAKPAKILGDATQLQQVLINLILNSMEALEGAPADKRTIQLKVKWTEAAVLISVEDQGPGFADPDLSKLFESFFSTKRTGMGLGLSIARTIVEAHGGSIWAEKNAGGGASFNIQLPVYRELEAPG